TGIAFVKNKYSDFDGYVTCDADGQHTIDDIINISRILSENPDKLVLGERNLEGPDIPRKSRFGNRFSSFYFKLATGLACHDTQTGLRGIPKTMTDMALETKGARYDYEMNFLIRVAKETRNILMTPISTVYLDNNSASHFRPIVDSYRVYKEPIKFALSSLFCAGIDLGIFTLVSYLFEDSVIKVVALATISARIVSGITNFLLNRFFSFKSFSSISRQFRRYFILYIVQMLLSMTFVYLLSSLSIHLTLVKAIVDLILFVGSFFIQKHWVYQGKALPLGSNIQRNK
ncbi:MAG TPA: GtrA family protein, partial [Bacillota bacterium]|nr:GtrA family protein [Bacillota bacterium]